MKLQHYFTLLGAFLLVQIANAQQATYNNLPHGPYGGGTGYSSLIQDLTGYTIVNSFQQLVNAVQNPAVDKIYIANGSTIIIPDDFTLVIQRNNLIIAGGRGKQGVTPGVIKRASNTIVNSASRRMINIQESDNVRITGLIISGPGDLCPQTPQFQSVGSRVIIGLRCANSTNIEVDNCLIENFSNTGIEVAGSNPAIVSETSIHHNVIKNNNVTDWGNSGSSYGYGVVTSGNKYLNGAPVHAEIAYNLFENNKHAIAGSGYPGESYTAVYNCDIPNDNNNRKDHSFDMHGYFDKGNILLPPCAVPRSACNWAGENIVIEHNSFESLKAGQKAIAVRGVPQTGASVKHNFFEANAPTSSTNDIIWQVFKSSDKEQDPTQFMNIDFQHNTFGSSFNYLYTSWDGSADDKLLAPYHWDKEKVKAADFDGDGYTDLIRNESHSWKVSRRATGNWENWPASSPYPNDPNELLIEDFTGDNKADLFATWGGEWWLSTSTGSGFDVWRKVGVSNYGLDRIQAGDFNNDGLNDLVIHSGGHFLCAFKNDFNIWFGSWTQLSTTQMTAQDFKTGDFDGNGYTDIIISNGTNQHIAFNSSTGFDNWIALPNQTTPLADIIVDDFNGDSKDDLFHVDNVRSSCSYASLTFPNLFDPRVTIKLNDGSFLKTLHGDFNNDQKADILQISHRKTDYKTSSFKTSPALSIEEKTGPDRWKLYPNPSSGVLNIALDKIYQNVLLRIVDYSGRVVQQNHFDNRGSLNTTLNGPKGIYLIQISADQEPVKTYTIMKE